MQDNRRQHERLEIDHPANLVVGDHSPVSCTIKNYSEGGLYLQVESAALAELKSSNRAFGESIVQARVRLLDLESGADLPFDIPMKIVFAGEQGYGAVFMDPSREVLEYLKAQHQNHASSSSNVAAQPLSDSVRLLLSEIKNALSSHVDANFSSFVSHLTDELLSRSEHASLQQQSNYAFAAKAIEQSKDSLKKSLVERLSMVCEQPLQSHGQSDISNQQLELVDQEEFDEWSSISTIARAYEGDHSAILHTLSQCFAYTSQAPISSDSNPLSPYSFLWAFKKSLVPLDLHRDARNIVFKVFGESILGNMDELYVNAFDGFKASGVVAKIENSLKPLVGTDSRTPPRSGGDQPQSTQRKPSTLINKLSSLFGERSTAKMKQGTQQVATNEALVSALDSLPQGDGRTLLSRIESSLENRSGSNEQLVLPGEKRQIIAATEQLIDAVQQDPRHGEVMQALLNQIQVPLVKQALSDPAALNNAETQSRQLLEDIDQLALITPSSGGTTKIQQANIELKNILSALQSAGGSANLNQVSEQISGLLEKRKSDFSANIQQVQDSCLSDMQSANRIAEVRQFLTSELGSSISSLVDQLLRFGWAGLLAETAIQGDASAKSLKAYQNVLLLLNKAYQPSNRSVTLEEKKCTRFEQVLRRGFDAYPLYRSEGENLIEKIGQSIRGDKALFELFNKQRVEVTETYLDELLPDSRGEPSSPESSENTVDNRLPAMQEGDWIIQNLKQGQVRLLNLIWVSPEHNRYVFVDGAGVKSLDCSQLDLAEKLETGLYSIIEDGGLPMIDRAVDRVLRQTFDRLRDESDLDTVTGLPNRRAYDRELSRLIKLSKAEHTNHVLICADVDNFSLVNDLHGYEGGDDLLGRVAGVCKSFIPRTALLARTGDNEFSILVEGCSVDEGFRVAESVRKAIENLRFEWAGRVLSITASIGLTEVTAAGGTQDSITQAATLACEQAKKEGRNCSRRYQPDGEIFAQRRRMAQSVPMIEDALKNDQLSLHAQLISPIFVGEGHHEHHEILLRRLDDAGNPCSPFEIIEAAEQFDRMRAVDRWVVQRFFKWAESASSKHDLSSMGGFSINLSGQSMTDDAFHEFLLSKVRSSPIPPEQLSFEITETAMVSQIDKARKLILQLKELGCTFFLDDFGSGYANYSYLKDFPIDVVKIDGIFVKSIHEDETSYAMVKSITDVAHNLGKLVVAEFVENEAILNALREMEVDFAQGYCLGRPVPLDDLAPQNYF